MTKTKRKDNGFTLIELLVTMAIMVGVVFAAGGAIMLLTRTMETTNQLTNDNSAARSAMMRLTREARSATFIEVEPRSSGGGGGDAGEDDTPATSEFQSLYLHFASSTDPNSGTVVLYYRNPDSGQLARIQGTYTTSFVDDGEGGEMRAVNRSGYGASEDTGVKIRRFATRIEYDDRDRGWLYIRIRADHNIDLDSNTFDQNLLLDTKIALNRLAT